MCKRRSKFKILTEAPELSKIPYFRLKAKF